MVHPSTLIVNETRIRDADGFCGTVVYVGTVASAKNSEEIYAGIRWDDASRGKHDGSVICRRTNQLVRHFSCGPTQGSFLRLSKVDLGAILDAEMLKSKYVEMDAPLVAPNNLLPHVAQTSSGRDKPVEFLGEMKIRRQQQLGQIHKISLRCEGISRCCSQQELQDFQHITDIDLAGNLISNWKMVMEIIRCFPNLECFSVASNRIRDMHAQMQPCDLQLPPALHQIKTLNLNRCEISTSRTMAWIGRTMPNLEELCIAHSDLSDLSDMLDFETANLNDGSFQQLRLLDCSSCNLTDWMAQISKFGSFPNLAHLSLDDNALTPIPVDENATVGSQEQAFVSLLSLQIAGTKIARWEDMRGVHSLGIKSLRLKNTPLTSTMGQGEARSMAIAQFPSLSYLNASLVSTNERKEAERRYVSMVTRLLQSTSLEPDEATRESNRQSLLAKHPQYDTLKDEHRDVIAAASNSTAGGASGSGGSTLSATVANLMVRSMAASSCSMEPLVRRLPGSLTVGRLKALCSRYFGLDTDLISLHYRTQADAFPIELDADDNTLDYYGVSDGGEMLMNEVDLRSGRDSLNGKSVDGGDDIDTFESKVKEQERDLIARQELQRHMESGGR